MKKNKKIKKKEKRRRHVQTHREEREGVDLISGVHFLSPRTTKFDGRTTNLTRNGRASAVSRRHGPASFFRFFVFVVFLFFIGNKITETGENINNSTQTKVIMIDEYAVWQDCQDYQDIRIQDSSNHINISSSASSSSSYNDSNSITTSPSSFFFFCPFRLRLRWRGVRGAGGRHRRRRRRRRRPAGSCCWPGSCWCRAAASPHHSRAVR